MRNKYDNLPELHAELGKSYAGLGKAALELKDSEPTQYNTKAISEFRKAIASSPDDTRFKKWLTEAIGALD